MKKLFKIWNELRDYFPKNAVQYIEKRQIGIVFLSIVLLAVSISTYNFIYILIALGMIIFLNLTTVHIIYLFVNDNVLFMDGTCIEKEIAHFMNGTSIIKRSYALIEYNGVIYTCYMTNRILKKLHVGQTLSIYVNRSNVYQGFDGTITINYPLFVIFNNKIIYNK